MVRKYGLRARAARAQDFPFILAHEGGPPAHARRIARIATGLRVALIRSTHGGID
ncbi:hypothetical protein ACFWP0_15475 [Achromobacter sp. NPDC058515]|uniref:hypothetical protein n=1 Tax=Achromobacter sp. NPDC058515 TaxID=3346533 RepID=UPI003653C7E5